MVTRQLNTTLICAERWTESRMPETRELCK